MQKYLDFKADSNNTAHNPSGSALSLKFPITFPVWKTRFVQQICNLQS